MIVVSVRYYNLLRRRSGIETEMIALPRETSLRAVLEYLADCHGPNLQEMLFAPRGDVASHLVIFRNRRLVRSDQHHLSLCDGDELMLFPAVSGG
jgi:molybdopterin converting factor small subunit